VKSDIEVDLILDGREERTYFQGKERGILFPG